MEYLIIALRALFGLSVIYLLITVPAKVVGLLTNKVYYKKNPDKVLKKQDTKKADILFKLAAAIVIVLGLLYYFTKTNI